MSVMERRLQLLLDQARYAKVEQEARLSGRSVSAVIREAIDVRFADDAQARRQEAARQLLEMARTHPDKPGAPVETWAEMKQAMEDDLDSRYPK